MLKRSMDRKVANGVKPNGKQPLIANAFGLPSGKLFSCPEATSICEKICYAGKLEKLYPSVKNLLLHNWNELNSSNNKYSLLFEMINEFDKDCNKRKAKKLFRIHWDGDFYSDDYILAWKQVILDYQEIQFWCYTRTKKAIELLHNITNLSLYYSTDNDNKYVAEELHKKYNIKLAIVDTKFDDSKEFMKNTVGKIGAKCPEQTGQIKLIDSDGSACAKCQLCIYNKVYIRFSISKK